MPITPYLTPFEFGAVGDCQGTSNLGTDDTAAIQNCIDTAVATGIKNIYLGNHRITDLDLTGLTGGSGDGLVFYSLNRKHAYTGGFSNLFVSGAAAQGIDLSGTSNISFIGITISGDTTSGQIPRCAIFAQRINQGWGDASCMNNRFTDMIIDGKFQYAAVYNYGGESWIFDKCTVSTSLGTSIYCTSKNSYAYNCVSATKTSVLLSKFTSPSAGLSYVTNISSQPTITTSQTSLPVLDVSSLPTTETIVLMSNVKTSYNIERITYTGKAAAKSIASADINATTEVITWTSHGLQTGYVVSYTGTLISGITSGLKYYVIYDTVNSIKLASSYANAIIGTAINISVGTGPASLTPQVLTGCTRGVGGTTAATYTNGTAVTTNIINYHDMTDTIITNSNITTSDTNSPGVWLEGAMNTYTPIIGYCSGTTVTITEGSANMKIGQLLITRTGTSLGTVISGSGTTYTVSIGGTYASSSATGIMYLPNVPYTITASCSGTTLTITSGTPYLTVGMIVYANSTGFGGYVSLGQITAGSGTSWTVSIGGTYASQTMDVSTQGYLDYNNVAGRMRIRDTYVSCNYAPYVVLLTHVSDTVILDGINDETIYDSQTTDCLCKVLSGHPNAPLTTLSFGNSVTTAQRAIRVQGLKALVNFNDMGGTTFVNGGKVL